MPAKAGIQRYGHSIDRMTIQNTKHIIKKGVRKYSGLPFSLLWEWCPDATTIRH